jgi:hypothetical protein
MRFRLIVLNPKKILNVARGESAAPCAGSSVFELILMNERHIRGARA